MWLEVKPLRGTPGNVYSDKWIGMLSDAELSSEINWRSVALSASSDMLLIRPIFTQPPGSESNKTGISVSLHCDHGSGVEGLLQIGNDVVDVLDADAQANQLRGNAGVALFFGRHLPVSGGGRVARERLGIAEIYQPLDQFQGVIEFDRSIVTALESDRHQRTSVVTQVLLRQVVVRALRKACVRDPCDPLVVT